MKRLLLWALTAFLLLPNYECFAQLAQTYHAANNTALVQFTPSKNGLVNDVNTISSGGFILTANYNRTTDVNEFFLLKDNLGNTLLSFSIRGNTFIVNRYVRYQECLNWDVNGCRSYSYPIAGKMEYHSWDENLMSNSGWFSVAVADNGVFVKHSKTDNNGPFVSDLSYWGLSESQIEKMAISDAQSTLKVTLSPSSQSNITLTDINLQWGQIPYVAVVNPEMTGSSETSYLLTQSVASVNKSVSLALEQTSGEEKVSIFPNPAAEILKLSTNFEKEMSSSLSLFDIQGRLLTMYERLIPKGEHELNLTLNRQVVPSGVVLYEFRYGNEISRGKLLIK